MTSADSRSTAASNPAPDPAPAAAPIQVSDDMIWVPCPSLTTTYSKPTLPEVCVHSKPKAPRGRALPCPDNICINEPSSLYHCRHGGHFWGHPVAWACCRCLGRRRRPGYSDITWGEAVYPWGGNTEMQCARKGCGHLRCEGCALSFDDRTVLGVYRSVSGHMIGAHWWRLMCPMYWKCGECGEVEENMLWFRESARAAREAFERKKAAYEAELETDDEESDESDEDATDDDEALVDANHPQQQDGTKEDDEEGAPAQREVRTAERDLDNMSAGHVLLGTPCFNQCPGKLAGDSVLFNSVCKPLASLDGRVVENGFWWTDRMASGRRGDQWMDVEFAWAVGDRQLEDAQEDTREKWEEHRDKFLGAKRLIKEPKLVVSGDGKIVFVPEEWEDH